MENTTPIFTDLYDDPLTTIKGIKFTHREIDIIASIIHMRGSSRIASLLSISTRTVETHTANIMRKMDVNSREGIIDFVEKTGHSLRAHKHYQNLLIQADFKKRLREVLKLTQNKPLHCFIIYEKEPTGSENFLSFLKEHLVLCGIKTAFQVVNHEESMAHSLSVGEFPPLSHIIYKVPQRFLEELQANQEKWVSEFSRLLHKISPSFSSLTFLVSNKDDLTLSQNLKTLGAVGTGRQQDYFSIFFKVLKKILPDINVDGIVSEFLESLQKNSEASLPTLPQHQRKIEEKEKIVNSRKVWMMAISAVLIVAGGCWLPIFRSSHPSNIRQDSSIRSDLIVPAEHTFLDRPNIISDLKESLNMPVHRMQILFGN